VAGDDRTAPTDDRGAAFREAVTTGVGEGTWAVHDGDGERMWLDVRYELATIGGTERVLGSVRDATARWELSTRTEQVATLHDAATRIQRCETTLSVYEEVVAAAEEILEFDTSVADELVGDTLRPRAVSTALSEDEYYETTPLDAEDNLAARVCRTGEPSVVTDLTQRDVTPADTAFRSVLTVPLGEHGVFQAASRTVDTFDDSDLELTELLAAHAREALSRLEREQELRERTRELRREKERSEVFASAVSHDLRNPLNVATGHLQLARRDRDDDHLATVADALDRMEAITEDVLTIAREGATVESLEPVALASLADDCWGNIDTADATLQVRLPDGLVIAADPRRLQHIVENLFRNALDHAGPQPTIELGVLSDGEGFYVADDGPGIDPESREEVFQPGYSTATDGTGFGLAIVDEMAGAHGWTLSVAESADGGARFEFTGVDTEPTS
jgi:Signal transduction histidine kinase